jgi:hypothetical protein
LKYTLVFRSFISKIANFFLKNKFNRPIFDEPTKLVSVGFYKNQPIFEDTVIHGPARWIGVGGFGG